MNENAKISRRLLTGTILRFTTLIINIVVTFKLMPLIIATLGDTLYGLWAVVGYFVGYYGLLDLGISAAITRFVARAHSKNDKEEINYIASTGLVVFFCVGLFARKELLQDIKRIGSPIYNALFSLQQGRRHQSPEKDKKIRCILCKHEDKKDCIDQRWRYQECINSYIDHISINAIHEDTYLSNTLQGEKVKKPPIHF